MNIMQIVAEVISPATGASSPSRGERESQACKGFSPLSPDSPLSGAGVENTLPVEITTLIARLDAAGLLADGDHDLIAEMHELDPEGTAWLLGDMLLRGARA